jgi:hypothetical protein
MAGKWGVVSTTVSGGLRDWGNTEQGKVLAASVDRGTWREPRVAEPCEAFQETSYVEPRP